MITLFLIFSLLRALILWGLGSFILWAFGIALTFTFWHALAISFIITILNLIFK